MSGIQSVSGSGGPMAQGASVNPSVVSSKASNATPAQRVVNVSSSAQASANFTTQLARPKFDAGEMRQRLEEAVRQLNEQASANNRNLAFNIDGEPLNYSCDGQDQRRARAADSRRRGAACVAQHRKDEGHSFR